MTTQGFGTENPLIVVTASPARNWMVLCQARQDTDGNGRVSVSVGPTGELEGDALQTYFVAADSRETRIRQFLGNDPSGRYVAYRTENELWLLDTVTNNQIDLAANGAETTDDGQSFTTHRALSFGPRGRSVAYLRTVSGETTVVVRDLVSGEQREHPVGSGLVGRLSFEPDGDFIRLDVVLADSNGNGRVQWPFPPAKDKSGPCAGPIPRYNVWQFPGDESKPRLLRLSTGELIDAPGFVMTVGENIVVRNDTAELRLLTPSGERRKISSDTCNARVLHADAKRETVVFGCAGAYGARRDIFLRTPTARKHLNVDIAAFEQDTRFDGYPDWLALYPHNDSTLLNLEDGELYKLPEGSRTLATFTTNALVDDGGKLLFAHLDGADTKPKLHWTATNRTRKPLEPLLIALPLIALGEELFDIEHRRWLGRFSQTPLAVSSDGRGLIPRRPGTDRRLALGPVQWEAAAR